MELFIIVFTAVFLALAIFFKPKELINFITDCGILFFKAIHLPFNYWKKTAAIIFFTATLLFLVLIAESLLTTVTRNKFILAITIGVLIAVSLYASSTFYDILDLGLKKGLMKTWKETIKKL